MKQINYHEMKPADIRIAREECPVAYVPIGTLEWHGVHNPVGLDALKTTAMAEQFARNIGGMVMPTMWWADHRAELAEVVFDESPGAEWGKEGGIDHRPGMMDVYGLELDAFMKDADRSASDGGWDTYELVLRNTFFEIMTLGFKVIVTIAGHYPLQGPAHRAAESFNALKRATVLPIIGYDLVADRYKGDHAAQWETSLMLHLRPELVDMSRLDPDPNVKPVGVMGVDPRDTASAEYGKEGMDAMIEALRVKVNEALV
jgi:creatinine amidohydrolase